MNKQKSEHQPKGDRSPDNLKQKSNKIIQSGDNPREPGDKPMRPVEVEGENKKNKRDEDKEDIDVVEDDDENENEHKDEKKKKETAF
jgi:hypothetical protein